MASNAPADTTTDSTSPSSDVDRTDSNTIGALAALAAATARFSPEPDADNDDDDDDEEEEEEDDDEGEDELVPSLAQEMDADVVASQQPYSDYPQAPNDHDQDVVVLPGGPKGSLQSPFPVQDGRIRNAVPSKLKGKTDGKKGNFAVMQIDLTRFEMTERDRAAKRTSEGTEAAARRANKGGYKSVKRSKLVWMPPRGDLPGMPPIPPEAEVPAPPPPPPVAYPVPPPYLPAPAPPAPNAAPASGQPSSLASASQAPSLQPPPRGPPPPETKADQARLLTLLRSLHPVLVVDQICKALAYFGGIPGAPPPADGIFPQSASTNGSGALFVSWLSEIFPPLDGRPGISQPPGSLPAIGAMGQSSSVNGMSIPVKRTRGRPKGSKGSKVRRDKGKKKTSGVTVAPGTENTTQQTPGEASGATQANATIDVDAIHDQEPQNQSFAAPQASGGEQQDPNTSLMSTPGSRKRGRPKGSKNRPKPKQTTQDGTTQQENPDAAASGANTTQDPDHSGDSPLAHRATNTQTRPADTQVDFNTQDDFPGQYVGQGPGVGVATGANNVETPVPLPPQAHAHAHAHAMTSSSVNSVRAPAAASRKRKPSSQSLPGSAAAGPANTMSTDTSVTMQPRDAMAGRSVSASQVPQVSATSNKRRRISREPAANQSFASVDSQPSGTEASASPNISSASMTQAGQRSASQSFGAVSSQGFDSNTAVRSRGSNARMNQRQQQQAALQHQQSPQLQHPQPNNNVNQFQQHQQSLSPNMASSQHQQQQQQTSHTPVPIPTPAPARQRTQVPAVPNRQAPMTPQQQAYFQEMRQQQQQRQQQMANQYGQQAGSSGNYNTSMGANSAAQFQRRMNTQSPGYNLRQQTSHQPQQPQQHDQQQQQQQQQQQSQSMDSFQGYGDQSYLSMGYNMTSQNPAAAVAAAAAFGGQPQLEAALATEPNLQDRLYHQAIGRR